MNNKGISLMSMVITIIVIIILAGIVIMPTGEDSLQEANKVRFQNDLKGLVTALQVYEQETEMYGDKNYDFDTLVWDGSSEKAENTAMIEKKGSGEEDSIRYIFNGNVPKTLKGLITIKNGKIVLDGKRKPEVEWAKELYSGDSVIELSTENVVPDER